MKNRLEIHRGIYNREKVRDFRCASCALHVVARSAQQRNKRLRNKRRSHELQPQLLGVIDHSDLCLVTLSYGCRLFQLLLPFPCLPSAIRWRLLSYSLSFSFSTLFFLAVRFRQLKREASINVTFANSSANS